MGKLNQVLAVEKSIKSRRGQAITEAYHLIQKDALLQGISRSYRPKEDGGDQYPSENTKVQVNAKNVLENVADNFSALWDLIATKDWANCNAKADVIVDGNAVILQAPVTFLLSLEKDLTDLHTFISKLPVLPPADEWEHDDVTDVYRSKEVETIKSKKIPRNHVKAEATDKHPAQVEVYYEDTLQGYWTTVKFSGALPQSRINQLLERVNSLRDAVKKAREEANGIDVDQQHIGQGILEYLLAD